MMHLSLQTGFSAVIGLAGPIADQVVSHITSRVAHMQDRWAHSIVIVTSLLGCLATSRAIADDRSDVLVPPRYAAGEHLILKTHSAIDGVMTASSEEQSIKIPIKLTNKSVTITQIASERDGRPTEVVVDYATDYALTEAGVQSEDGTIQKNVTAVADVLDGKIVRYSVSNGQWIGKLQAEPEPTPDVRQKLEGYVPPHEDSILDQKTRRHGDKWTVGSLYLRRYFPDALKLKGDGECEYERVVHRDDRTFAIIAWSFEMEATTVDADGEEVQTKMGGSGRTWLDLATGIEERSEGRGTVVLTGRVPDVPVPMRIAGSWLNRTETRRLIEAETTVPGR